MDFKRDWYTTTLQQRAGKQTDVTALIEMDLMRTFPYNKLFQDQHSEGMSPPSPQPQLTPAITRLRRVLVAFSYLYPVVGCAFTEQSCSLEAVFCVIYCVVMLCFAVLCCILVLVLRCSKMCCVIFLLALTWLSCSDDMKFTSSYCQGMNKIVAFALLYLAEEEAFWSEPTWSCSRPGD